MAKKTDYKSMSDKDLGKALAEKHESLRLFRFGKAGSKTRNVKEGSLARKGVARILTEMNSRKTK